MVRFTDSIVKGLQGKEGVVECAYVASDVTEAKYFANPLLLGPHGVQENLGLGELNEFEQVMVAWPDPLALPRTPLISFARASWPPPSRS